MKTIKVTDPGLGPAMVVEGCYIYDDGNLVLVVDHSKTKAQIPKDNINETIKNAFIFIVNEFLKKNDIGFKPSGNFDSAIVRTFIGKDRWGFRIYGKETDPMEYFIDNLNK